MIYLNPKNNGISTCDTQGNGKVTGDRSPGGMAHAEEERCWVSTR